MRSPANCGKSSGPAQRTSSPTCPRSTTASRTRRSSSASTPLRCRLPGDGTIRSLPTTSRWYSSPTSDPGSCTCRTAPSPPGQIYAISSLAPSRAATNPMARQAIFICLFRRRGSLCASSSRGSAVCTTTSQNVRNRRMREEMAMCKIKEVSELYALADKCARAEEGRKLPGESVGEGEYDSEGTAPARRGRRRNGKKKKNPEVLVVEKSGSKGSAKKAQAGGPGKEVVGCAHCRAVAAADKRDGTDKKYRKIHRTRGHDLQSCKQVERLIELQKAEYARRDKERAQEGGGGSDTKRPGPGERRGKDKQRQADRPPRGRDQDEDDDDDEDMEDPETSEQEFQKATEVLCVDGGASLHASRHQLKQWGREVNAAEPPVESRKPLKWSGTPIIFDIEDHPDRTTAIGCLLMLVSPTVRNLKVTKMLVDGGAGLNLISSAVLRKLQVPDSELEETV